MKEILTRIAVALERIADYNERQEQTDLEWDEARAKERRAEIMMKLLDERDGDAPRLRN